VVEVVFVVFVDFVVVVLISDCGTGIGVWLEVEVEVEVVLKPKPPVTPEPPVGIVTETAAGCAAGVEGCTVMDVTVCCADVFADFGHSAATIPPFFTIPNKVLELTLTLSQDSDTALAIVFSPATQSAEHPLLKSETAQDGIWLSYVN